MFHTIPMSMTKQDIQTSNNSTVCHVCEKPLNDDSVRDHCHITGQFRGAAHNKCNLKLRLDKKRFTVPVVFHNLRGYDSHLLMQAISKVGGEITCIPNNTEKYISFSLGQLRFIDSAQFLLASLDKLVSANKVIFFKHYLRMLNVAITRERDIKLSNSNKQCVTIFHKQINISSSFLR